MSWATVSPSQSLDFPVRHCSSQQTSGHPVASPLCRGSHGRGWQHWKGWAHTQSMLNYSGFCLLPPLIPQANISITGSNLLAPASIVRSRSFETCSPSSPHSLGVDEECPGTLGLSGWHPPVLCTLQLLLGICRHLPECYCISLGAQWTWVLSSSTP